MNRDDLRKAIIQAFAGVTLGEGIGLYEAQAIDDYAYPDERADARLRDRETDWSNVTVSELIYNDSSLSFFDPEGMRFHLGSFLLAAMDEEYGNSLIFSLTFMDDDNNSHRAHSINQFSLLDLDQRKVIGSFLRYCRDDPEYDFERISIEKALAGYWSGDLPPPIS